MIEIKNGKRRCTTKISSGTHLLWERIFQLNYARTKEFSLCVRWRLELNYYILGNLCVRVCIQTAVTTNRHNKMNILCVYRGTIANLKQLRDMCFRRIVVALPPPFSFRLLCRCCCRQRCHLNMLISNSFNLPLRTAEACDVYCPETAPMFERTNSIGNASVEKETEWKGNNNIRLRLIKRNDDDVIYVINFKYPLILI